MATLHVIAGASETPARPVVRRIGIADLIDALRLGWEDFKTIPSHAIFLCLIYPLVGFFIGGLMLGYNLLPLLFPVSAGFALIGPFAALGIYELSRRREAGLDMRWSHAFDVLHSPSFGAIAAIGFLLMALFLAWLAVAQWIYQSLFGVLPPESISQFLHDVFTTPQGWKLILYGNAAGLVFAIAALAVSVVSFPLLLDRDVGAAVAIMTSIARDRGQSGADGGLGSDRGGAALRRVAAILRGARGRDADPRTCDLASLSQGDRPLTSDPLSGKRKRRALARRSHFNRWHRIRLPTASLTHFFICASLAAPDNFFAVESFSQVAFASVSHLVMKLVIAAPASFLVPASTLHDAAKALLATSEKAAARIIDFMAFS